nr:RNA exonuclease 1 homolog [Microcebus murinus]
MTLRATAPCWHPEASEVARESHPSALWQPSQDCLFCGHPMCNQTVEYIVIQAEPPRRGPDVFPAWPTTAQQMCCLSAPQAQRESANRLQACGTDGSLCRSPLWTGRAHRPAAVKKQTSRKGPRKSHPQSPRRPAYRKGGPIGLGGGRAPPVGGPGAVEAAAGKGNAKGTLPSSVQRMKSFSSHISAPGKKKRITHVPNVYLVTARTGAKRTMAASGSQPYHAPGSGRQQLKTCKLSAMASKTVKTTTTVPHKRVAHSQSFQSLKQLTILKEFGDNVTTIIRRHYLLLFIEECLKFCASNHEAVEKALNEEKVAYDSSPSMNVYLNMTANTLKQLRGLVPSAVPGLNRAALYSRLKEYVLTEDQLKENGYPFLHPKLPGGAVLFTAKKQQPQNSSCRVCCRCGTEYLVSSSGHCVSDEECHYHWGRLHQNPVAGRWETRYTCCSAPPSSVGCQVAKRHVRDSRKEDLQGFVKTFRKESSADAHPGIYALDCEMSYTTYGLEVTRVTVVNTERQVVYDTFVKPINEIVDYNTRFSGVTEADLANTSTRLQDVQTVLLSMFSEETILIGHSLESDLLALKVIHSTVVDTSVLFPHYLGLPYKRSLRNLTASYLRQIIQDKEDGHISSEDAAACMSLVFWKVQEDAQIKG